MAQTGYTPIQLYYSATTTNAPTAGNLAAGELAINTADGKLFYKDSSNAVQVIGWKTTPATAGGTGQTSYAVGDLLYASTTTALSKLADVATGNALISGGVGVAPSYGKIGLTTHVSGTLPIANGGTNSTATPTNGGVGYGTGTAHAYSAAGTSGQVLISAGAAAPTWSAVTGTGSVVKAVSPTITGNGTTIEGLTVGLGLGAVTSNAAFGISALATNTTGAQNTAVGYQALNINSTGSGNTGVGYSAGSGSYGSNNTYIGKNSGSGMTSGSNNVIVGSFTGFGAPIFGTNDSWIVLSDGAGLVRQAVDPAGNAQFFSGALVVYAPAPTTISAATTLTNAQIQGQLIVTSGTSFTLTMPTASTLATLVTWGAANTGYDFSVINTASGTITMAVNTDVTSVGTLTVPTGVSARFRIRNSGAVTFVLYRIS